MTGRGASAFERRDVVAAYEAWYETPYGRLVDRIETELILERLGGLPAGASVLEIGCGTGWFGRALAQRGFEVAGVDPSAAMLAHARGRFPVVRGDAARLPFPDRAFDAALIVGVLDFVRDPAAVLREARRVVRHSVVVLALASGSWLALRRRLRGRMGHPVFSQARFYSRAKLLALARASGAEPRGVASALLLPPALAGRLPSLETWLGRRTRLGAGLVAFSLSAETAPR
jgi:ubiquinone/menaquinone biosynthesis C-methylase UbiE